jgi:hypothetical protein
MLEPMQKPSRGTGTLKGRKLVGLDIKAACSKGAVKAVQCNI